MSVAVTGWQFLSDGGVIELLGGVTAAKFEEHMGSVGKDTPGVALTTAFKAYTGKVVVPSGPGTEVYRGSGDRGIFRQLVRFPAAFSAEPAVVIGLAEIDIDRDRDSKLRIEIHEVFPHGFTYSFNTWGNAQVTKASATWMAVGPTEAAAGIQQSQEP
jgi:hypothetical protein